MSARLRAKRLIRFGEKLRGKFMRVDVERFLPRESPKRIVQFIFPRLFLRAEPYKTTHRFLREFIRQKVQGIVEKHTDMRILPLEPWIHRIDPSGRKKNPIDGNGTLTGHGKINTRFGGSWILFEIHFSLSSSSSFANINNTRLECFGISRPSETFRPLYYILQHNYCC